MNFRPFSISFRCVLTILLPALLISCTDEMDDADEYRPSRWDALGMNFTTIYDGFVKPTRSVIESIDDVDKIGVLAMKKKDEPNWVKVFDNDTLIVSNVDNTKWSYDQKKKKEWEADYGYIFRGFYPTAFKTGADQESCAGFSYSIAYGSTELTLDNYKSASDPRQNSDIMVSQVVERKNETSVVPLKMNHLLACVDFKFKAKEGQTVTVTNFSIVGYAKEGRCTYTDQADWRTVSSEISSSKEMTIEVEYNGANKTVTSMSTEVVFKDKTTHQEISAYDMFEQSNSRAYTNRNDWNNPNYKNFYVVFTNSDPLKKEGTSITNTEGLLFIPQELNSTVEETVKVNLAIKRSDWGGNISSLSVDGISITRSTYAVVEYYFNNKPTDKRTATIDLTANKQVKKWDAGKRYTYNIGMYEYQTTSNIYVEDWVEYTHDEELK